MDIQKDRQMDTQTDRQLDTQTDRQMDKQTDITHIDIDIQRQIYGDRDREA